MIPSDIGIRDPGGSTSTSTSKFSTFHKGQLDAALEIASCSERFILLPAPTGSGKSLINISAALLMGARTLILVHTKSLQDQWLRDFSATGLVDVRGHSNYHCGQLNGGELECLEASSPDSCGQIQAIERARRSNLVITNYALWFALHRAGREDRLGEFDLLILDEAHLAHDLLADHLSVELDEYKVESVLEMDFRPATCTFDRLQSWARVASQRCEDRQDELKQERKSRGQWSAVDLLRRQKDLRRMQSSLCNIVEADPSNWLDKEKSSASQLNASPIWSSAYTYSILFRGIPKIVLASATLLPSIRTHLNIKSVESRTYELGSTFDHRRRPVIWYNNGPRQIRVSHSMGEGETRAWIRRIDQIINSRSVALNLKGILHSRSFARAQQISDGSSESSRMLLHTSRDRRRAIETFKRRSDGVILVSPSVEEGEDFPYDQCRYQIIAKIPFPDTRDPVMKARVDSDRSYGNYLAAQSVQQAVGRGMRGPKDWCETFIVDDHWAWFRNAAQFPKYFRSAFRVMNVLQAPPSDLLKEHHERLGMKYSSVDELLSALDGDT